MELIEENIKLVNRIENLENVFLKNDHRKDRGDFDEIEDMTNFN